MASSKRNLAGSVRHTAAACQCLRNGNWRMVFTFEGENAVLVDYRDYH